MLGGAFEPPTQRSTRHLHTTAGAATSASNGLCQHKHHRPFCLSIYNHISSRHGFNHKMVRLHCFSLRHIIHIIIDLTSMEVLLGMCPLVVSGRAPSPSVPSSGASSSLFKTEACVWNRECAQVYKILLPSNTTLAAHIHRTTSRQMWGVEFQYCNNSTIYSTFRPHPSDE